METKSCEETQDVYLNSFRYAADGEYFSIFGEIIFLYFKAESYSTQQSWSSLSHLAVSAQFHALKPDHHLLGTDATWGVTLTSALHFHTVPARVRCTLSTEPSTHTHTRAPGCNATRPDLTTAADRHAVLVGGEKCGIFLAQ